MTDVFSARGRPWSLAVCATILALYGVAASTHILGGDNAEFVTVAFDRGVAHPPGYPLYVLWLRALRWLPAASPAHAASLATALTGGLALVALSRAARAWGATEAGAAMAVVVFGSAPLAARLATSAEVFMLSAAIVAGILLVAAPNGPLRGVPRAVALGALAGLALCNHHSAVLIAPVGIWGAARGVAESRRRGVAGCLSVVALLACLSPYLLLVQDARHVAEGAYAWGDASTVRGLWRHFTRAEYGTFSLGLSTAPPTPLANVGLLVRSLLSETRWIGLIFAGFGAASLIRQPRPARLPGVLLIASLAIAGPLFVARFNVPLEALGQRVVERFFLLPLLLVSLLAGLGVSPRLARLPRAALAAPALIALALLANVAVVFPELPLAHAPTIENYLSDTLAVVPERSVVIGVGDHRLFGFAYLQRVRGQRPDVAYVDAPLLHYAWYRPRVAAAIGLPSDDPALRDARALTARLLELGRPVFVADPNVRSVVSAFPTYPFATVLRVVGPGQSVPSMPLLEAQNVEVFAHLHGSIAAPRDTWASGVRSDYARVWVVLADAYDRAGAPEDAARNRARAAEFLRVQ